MNVLYVHMDYYQNWKGDADEQWVKSSYDWLSEVLDYGLKREQTSGRVKNLMLDYHLYLNGEVYQDDPHFREVKKILTPFAKKHAEAITVCRKYRLNNINADKFVKAIIDEPSQDFALLSWAKQNEELLDLFLECARFDSLAQHMQQIHSNIETEPTDHCLSLHHNNWRQLMKEDGKWWVIYLSIVEREIDDKKVLSLQLKFNFADMNTEKDHLVKKIYDAFSKKTLNLDSVGKTKSVWLERDLVDDESSLCDLLTKYITKINNVLF